MKTYFFFWRPPVFGQKKHMDFREILTQEQWKFGSNKVFSQSGTFREFGPLGLFFRNCPLFGQWKYGTPKLLNWMRTEGICFSSVVATDSALWISFFSTEKFTIKYTWYRPSMDQKSLIDFCIVSSDMLSDVQDFRVRRSAELSTNHHLVVCSQQLSKPWPNRKPSRSSVTYRIKCEALEAKK